MARVGFCQEVFDQPHADVVAHAVQLGVDGGIVGFCAAAGEGEVAAEGGDDCAVGEGYDFGVDFVDARSGGWVREGVWRGRWEGSGGEVFVWLVSGIGLLPYSGLGYMLAFAAL